MKRLPLIVTLLLLVSVAASAQKADKMYEYNFRAAAVEYKDSLSAGCDSTIYSAALRNAESGITLSAFCHKPKVVARKRFGKEDFFLFYPLVNKTWHPTQYKGIYVCEPGAGADTVRVAQSDSLEYFSYISGNEKYFSSKSLYGVGGYDLYVSKWDERKNSWGAPENLGFPYSSPYDDFLFINTEDGKYSVFASNRECSEDSVNVYVLEYEPVRVRSEISEASELLSLCRLAPTGAPHIADSGASSGLDAAPDESTRKYIDKISHIRKLRDTIAINSKKLETLRDSYSAAATDKKEEIAKKISAEEVRKSDLYQRMEKESKALREIEMDFLMNGIAIDIEKLIAESNKVVALSETGYTFTKQELGAPVVLKYVKSNK